MPQFRLADAPFESVLIVAALLLLLSVVGSRFSALAGVPSLLVFLAIGMLAGSEGPGGIEFTDYSLTFILGSVSLAFIIFDGGLARALAERAPGAAGGHLALQPRRRRDRCLDRHV